MSHAPERRRARHLLVLVAAAAALVALVALVAFGIVIAVGSDNDQTSSARTTGTDRADGTAHGSASSDGDGEATARRDWETDIDTGLPIGMASQNGLPVGFPRTTEGAAAMVVELNRAQIGLNYEQSVATIRVYAAALDQVYFDDLATSAVAQRRENLGVPIHDNGGEIGDVLAPAGYAQTPIACQVEEYGTDRYLVSVLNEVTATTGNGQLERSAYVGQQLVAWNPDADRGDATRATGATGVTGDWELVEPSTQERERLFASPSPPTAPLGTREFERAGWTPLLEASTNASSSPSRAGAIFDQHVDEQ